MTKSLLERVMSFLIDSEEYGYDSCVLKEAVDQLDLTDHEILELWQSNQCEFKEIAMQYFVKRTRIATTQILLDGLQDTRGAIRKYTLEAIGEQVDKIDRNIVEQFLDDNDRSLQIAAITTLKRYGVTEALRQRLTLIAQKPHSDLRCEALRALYGDNRNIPTFVTCMQSSGWNVAETAVMGLASFGTESPVDLLAACFVEKDKYRIGVLLFAIKALFELARIGVLDATSVLAWIVFTKYSESSVYEEAVKHLSALPIADVADRTFDKRLEKYAVYAKNTFHLP